MIFDHLNPPIIKKISLANLIYRTFGAEMESHRVPKRKTVEFGSVNSPPEYKTNYDKRVDIGVIADVRRIFDGNAK